MDIHTCEYPGSSPRPSGTVGYAYSNVPSCKLTEIPVVSIALESVGYYKNWLTNSVKCRLPRVTFFKMYEASTPQSSLWAHPVSVYLRRNVLNLRGRSEGTCDLMRPKVSEAEV